MDCNHKWVCVKTAEFDYHGKWPCTILFYFCKKCRLKKKEYMMDRYGLNKPATLTYEMIAEAIAKAMN